MLGFLDLLLLYWPNTFLVTQHPPHSMDRPVELMAADDQYVQPEDTASNLSGEAEKSTSIQEGNHNRNADVVVGEIASKITSLGNDTGTSITEKKETQKESTRRPDKSTSTESQDVEVNMGPSPAPLTATLSTRVPESTSVLLSPTSSESSSITLDANLNNKMEGRAEGIFSGDGDSAPKVDKGKGKEIEKSVAQVEAAGKEASLYDVASSCPEPEEEECKHPIPWAKDAERPPQKMPIRFVDCVGRNFIWPWRKARTWKVSTTTFLLLCLY